MKRTNAVKQSGSPTGTTETSKLAVEPYLNLEGGKDREDKSVRKDANKQSGSSPTSMLVSHTAESWLDGEANDAKKAETLEDVMDAAFESARNSFDVEQFRKLFDMNPTLKTLYINWYIKDFSKERFLDLLEHAAKREADVAADLDSEGVAYVHMIEHGETRLVGTFVVTKPQGTITVEQYK